MLLGIGTELFLLDPERSATRRVMVPGRVVEQTPGGFVAELDEPLAIAPGGPAVAFAADGLRFLQQGVTLTDARADAARPTYAFARVGEPVSAEQRQTYRVSVALLGLTATVGDDDGCPLLDVSPEGFGVVSPRTLNLGSSAPVAFAHDGIAISTVARVQTLRERPDGQYRVGFLAPDRHGPARKSLQQMTNAFQRLQLRRMSGTAA